MVGRDIDVSDHFTLYVTMPKRNWATTSKASVILEVALDPWNSL